MKLKQISKILLITIPSFSILGCNTGYLRTNQTTDTSTSQLKVQNGDIVQNPVLNSTVPLLLMTSPEGTGICTGTLLDPSTVLTASHCVLNMQEKKAGAEYTWSDVISPQNINVYLSKDPSKAITLKDVGLLGITQIANVYQVASIYVHKYAFRAAQVSGEGFQLNDGGDLNDLTILKLKIPVSIKYDFPLVATVNPIANTNEIIAGYGVNIGSGVTIKDPANGNSGTLRSASSLFIDSEFNGKILNVGGITNKDDNSIYTKICQGDSGGPDFQLINGHYVLTGVHSFGDGINCGGANSPASSISVAAYAEWINGGYKDLSITQPNQV